MTQGHGCRCYTLLHGRDKKIPTVSGQQYRTDTAGAVSPHGYRNGSRSTSEETATMKKLFVMSALAGALTVAAVADASAWTRSATSTGPRGGTSSFQANGSCANGSCSRTATRTGPAGNTYTRQGTVTRY
jgi:uncharacterized low-complexity protein